MLSTCHTTVRAAQVIDSRKTQHTELQLWPTGRTVLRRADSSFLQLAGALAGAPTPTPTHTHQPAQTHPHPHARTRALAPTSTPTPSHSQCHTHTHTYMHANTHTHTHTPARTRAPLQAGSTLLALQVGATTPAPTSSLTYTYAHVPLHASSAPRPSGRCIIGGRIPAAWRAQKHGCSVCVSAQGAA